MPDLPSAAKAQHDKWCDAKFQLIIETLFAAGVLGQVGSSGALDHVDCSVGFRLVAPATGARILSAGLRCALLNKDAARRQPRSKGAFTADMGKLATAQPIVCTLPALRLLPLCLFLLCIAASSCIQHVLPVSSSMTHADDKAFACMCCNLACKVE